jgi:hypothetical protein
MNIRSQILLFLFFSLFSVSYGQLNDTIRLNEWRVLASHNSYKQKPNPKVLSFLQRFKKRLGDDMDPKRMDYGHLPLSEQFSTYGIRGIELDVYYDPKGGKYRKRRLNLFVGGVKQRVKDSVMRQPGFKMLHIADIDYETNYLTFIAALKEIHSWSKANPNHIPIYINIEPKNDSPGDYSRFLRFLGFKKATKFDEKAYLELDSEILSVFGISDLFTPTDLKGKYATIKERLSVEGWPRLNECLGKVFFIIDGDRNGMYESFLENGEKRPMFVYSEPTENSTAFVKRNDPLNNEMAISELTSMYIVRTRSDVETIHARNNDYSLLEAALKSQAQIISTDFYKVDPAIGTFEVLTRFLELK